jgi:hypothetical protein
VSRAISKAQCAQAVIKGIEDAHRNYEKWSGDWLWQGPEYLINTHVAERLASLDGTCYVTLESRVKEMLKVAGVSSAGAPKKALRRNGRFDIVLWWANGTPRAVIEAKNGVWSFANIEHDVARVAAAVSKLRTKSQIHFGAVAFYTSAKSNNRSDATKQLASLNNTLLTKTKGSVGDSIKIHQVPSKIHAVGGDAWTATCYIFES